MGSAPAASPRIRCVGVKLFEYFFRWWVDSVDWWKECALHMNIGIIWVQRWAVVKNRLKFIVWHMVLVYKMWHVQCRHILAIFFPGKGLGLGFSLSPSLWLYTSPMFSARWRTSFLAPSHKIWAFWAVADIIGNLLDIRPRAKYVWIYVQNWHGM